MNQVRGGRRETGAVYLREGNEYVGPFLNRMHAERFLLLMVLHGESLSGVKIVVLKKPPNQARECSAA